MKVLIAVISAAPDTFRRRVQSQRNTWFPLVKHADLRVFLGSGAEKMNDDEVVLGAPDDYEGLPKKIKAMFAWALENGYDGVWRIDDDAYVRPERLIPAPSSDYQGRTRNASDQFHPWIYCSGFCYWMSAKAMKLVVDTRNVDVAEDRLTGLVMAENDIAPAHDARLVITSGVRSWPCSDIGPRRDNDIAVSCEWSPESMAVAHSDYEQSSPPKPRPKDDPDFARVDILIKTILRDGFLNRTMAAIREHLPGARMIIVDDGVHVGYKPMTYAKMRADGHVVHLMHFDSGFGAKSNAAIPLYNREFVLIGSDDFDFSQAGEGIRKMIRVLDGDDSVGIASGRVGGNPYEFMLSEYAPRCYREIPIDHSAAKKVNGVTYYDCDLTVNYSLIRRELLGMDDNRLHWWNDVKIGGGEHGAFFIRAKRLGVKVVAVDGANIEEQRYFVGAYDPRYPGFRARARNSSRMALVHEGISAYWCHGAPEPERHM